MASELKSSSILNAVTCAIGYCQAMGESSPHEIAEEILAALTETGLTIVPVTETIYAEKAHQLAEAVQAHLDAWAAGDVESVSATRQQIRVVMTRMRHEF